MNRYEWTNRVLSASGPDSPTVRLVLVALLLQFFNEQKGYAWPSVATLAERTGHCERTVRAALGEAEAGGWLRRDAVPGHVTHYYPTVPEDRELRLTPAAIAGVGRKQPQGTPAALAYDLRKEHLSPPTEGRRAPACPMCSAPMKEERSRRTKEPMFWGCSQFRVSGCKGKLEFGEEPDPERQKRDADEREARKAAREAKEKADNEAAIARNREAAERLRKERGKPLLDAVDMAQAALKGALRHA